MMEKCYEPDNILYARASLHNSRIPITMRYYSGEQNDESKRSHSCSVERLRDSMCRCEFNEPQYAPFAGLWLHGGIYDGTAAAGVVPGSLGTFPWGSWHIQPLGSHQSITLTCSHLPGAAQRWVRGMKEMETHKMWPLRTYKQEAGIVLPAIYLGVD